MTHKQAIALSVLTGLVVAVFLGLTVTILTLPEAYLPIIIVTPTRTITPTPSITPTPTFPNFMPTTDPLFQQTTEPTVANTRVPTVTPKPQPTATGTLNLSIPTPIIFPSATPTNVPTAWPTTAPQPKATVTVHVPLGYWINFSAKDTRLEEGDCTELEWSVEGGKAIFLDGSSVAETGQKRVCPDETTTYRLEVQVIGNTLYETRKVVIDVVTVKEDLFGDDD